MHVVPHAALVELLLFKDKCGVDVGFCQGNEVHVVMVGVEKQVIFDAFDGGLGRVFFSSGYLRHAVNFMGKHERPNRKDGHHSSNDSLASSTFQETSNIPSSKAIAPLPLPESETNPEQPD